MRFPDLIDQADLTPRRRATTSNLPALPCLPWAECGGFLLMIGLLTLTGG